MRLPLKFRSFGTYYVDLLNISEEDYSKIVNHFKPLRWQGSTQMPGRNGSGSGYSLRRTVGSTRDQASKAVITWTNR